MALALVQKFPNSTDAVYTSSLAHYHLACSGTITANNLLISCCVTYAPTQLINVTDNKSNSWSTPSDVTVVEGADYRCSIHSALVTTGGADVEITFTPVSGNCEFTVAAIEVSGNATSSILDSTNSATGSSTAVSSGAASPAGNCFYVGLGTCGGTVTWAKAWTLLHEQLNSATGSVFCSEYMIGTGAQTATWTLSGSRAWAACVAAYKEAVAGGQSQSPRTMHQFRLRRA